MKKKFLRFVAGVMAFLLFSSGMGSAVAAYASDEVKKDTLLVAKQERVLTVTQDMVGKNGKLTITGEWDRIVVPKEIVASNVFFKDVKTGSVEIESGSKCNFEMISGEFGTVAVVPAKVEYMTVQDFIALYRLTKDPQAATKKYRDQLEENGISTLTSWKT